MKCNTNSLFACCMLVRPLQQCLLVVMLSAAYEALHVRAPSPDELLRNICSGQEVFNVCPDDRYNFAFSHVCFDLLTPCST
jgi:hypothetical protein